LISVDIWFWKYDATGIFSVKSAYSIVELASRVDVAPPEVPNIILAKLWKSWAPSKVIVFSWQLLQNRIPSRQNLLRRRVITDINNTFCVLCGNSVELVDHLFLTCGVSSTVWYSIFRWLGFQCVLPGGVIGMFEFLLGMGTGRRAHLRWLLIWHAVIWSIWNSRNELIFIGGSSSVEYLVDKVKLLTWKWYRVKNPGNLCSLYEWEMQPILCWNR
jgi:hypothetical protein